MTGRDSKQIDLPLLDNGKASDNAANGATGLGTRLARLQLWRLPLVMAVLFTGAVVGMYFQPPALRAFFGVTGLEPGGGSTKPIAVAASKTATTIHAPTQLPSEVAALGRLMPEGDTVTLALPFGAGDARVQRLLVAEGDRVEAGQVIAELDSLPQLIAQKTSAAAGVAARQAALVQTRASVLASLSEARASRDRAKAAKALADQDLARISDLAKRGVATQAQLDQAQSSASQAAGELDRTTASLARFEEADGGEQPDIALAARNLDVAKADLARAEQDLARAQVIAPQAGTVLALHVRVGEKPGAAGVATLGNIDQMQAELQVYQTDIRRVALGQSVILSAEALTAPLQGTVTRIGLEVERQTLLASDPAASTDARILRVRVALDAESSVRARAFTGLEVVGRIATGAE